MQCILTLSSIKKHLRCYIKKLLQEKKIRNKYESPMLLIMGAELGGDCRNVTRVLGELSPKKDTKKKGKH